MEMAMNRIEIEVLSSKDALAAFTRAWRQARAGRKAAPRLAFGSIAELFSAVSEKRLELVRHVAGDEGLQIRPLARALGRDYKNVHTDVQALIELWLLEKNERGAGAQHFDLDPLHRHLHPARRVQSSQKSSSSFSSDSNW